MIWENKLILICTKFEELITKQDHPIIMFI
jgi:hypothetical protein